MRLSSEQVARGLLAEDAALAGRRVAQAELARHAGDLPRLQLLLGLRCRHRCLLRCFGEGRKLRASPRRARPAGAGTLFFPRCRARRRTASR